MKPNPADGPPDPRPDEPDPLDHQSRQEKRTLAEITELYLALLRAEREKARRQD